MSNLKRPHQSTSDLNNNEIISNSAVQSKKSKSVDNSNGKKPYTIGQIKELRMLNFMCHKNFSIEFHPTSMQIVTGANGSGKSTIANAICLCLGAQARTTGRTTNVQSFIRKGDTHAELSVTLANEGAEAYKPEIYGKNIHIIRRIGAKQSSYKILGENRQVISTRKETIDEINQALSISPENPLCVLHQEIAKTFLLHSDPQKKYQFYMKVSQLDQIKQAYEAAVYTVQSIYQRINNMKDRHEVMLRTIELLERDVKKINIRREQDKKQHELEAELILARGMETQQELVKLQSELDQTQKSKDIIEARIIEATNQIRYFDQQIETLAGEKSDLEKDLNGRSGLRELKLHFAKDQKEMKLMIYRLSRECEKHHETLKDNEQGRIRLKKYIDEFEAINRQSNNSEEQRVNLNEEIQNRKRQSTEWNKTMESLTDDLNINDDNIRKNQSTINCIQNELKQKQNDIDELKKIETDKTNIYGAWVPECLKAIERDTRYHKKPIGPIGRHIRCIEPRWSYAVEKHLAASMSSFICTDNHDEHILLELFSKYCRGYRPTIIVKRFSEELPDVSGTLERVQRANLLSVYQVLKIDNITVACVLIDHKQIEATILIEDLQEATRIRQSGVLRWDRIYGKVKQVGEALTYDGSNIKLDKAFRIYTNDRQPARYFTSNSTQALSIEELNTDIKRLHDQIKQTNLSMNELKTIRQTTKDNLDKIKNMINENNKKIIELNQQLDRLNSTMPTAYDYSLDELQQKLKECDVVHHAATKNFEEAKEKMEVEHQRLEDVKRNLENIEKKFDSKTSESAILTEKINNEIAERQQIQQQIPKFIKKCSQFDEDIAKYQEQLNELNKNKPKKLKTSKTTDRSVRDIQQELDVINHFLMSNEDTIEKRQQIIDEFRAKRLAAQEFKRLYERCFRQVQSLEKFVNKRKERFGQIADEHQYLLRHKFKDLMEKYRFDDCDIKIDHKKEELEISIKKNKRSASSFSGGERSISTFCFLIALWGSIYQPFRLLDEIDIYMDNEKRNSCLEHLYENTQYYSSSQHVIFTPQAIDSTLWKRLNVPVFCMPTPKRSLE
ncbi:unnamed protein product [Rotaria socialis]|uniref:Rad50/SbcC-type AAA domain-containing protein n=1 Tax=Rotaria socialis TaxID=392032 RepID=A0A818P2E5_9BILA|nr:unnamed protein product [Rotaria socialis]CAF3614191.1 unnamed protein product [Rotaria socialis]CAF4244183.1 unnamed protein product [Rotaria socialis]CAF4334181.1 unnamed protein product [Rotaria socialis]